LTIISWYAHYQASRGDPGWMKSHHFKEEGVRYVTELGLKAVPEAGQEDWPVANFPLCHVCNVVKVWVPLGVLPSTEGNSALHVHHCRACNSCVLQMDHHCFYTDNCVAINNIKYFYIFMVSTAFQCVSAMLLILKYSIVNQLTSVVFISPLTS
jgi:hypothetical protein